MLKVSRTGVIVVAFLCVGGGVAAADPVTVPNAVAVKETVDGWKLTSSLTELTIDALPNLNGPGSVREAFVTATGTLDIAPTKLLEFPKDPPEQARLILGAQVVCQIRNTGGQVQAQPGFTTSLPNIGNLFNIIAGLPGSDLSNLGIAPTIDLQPQVNANLEPGVVNPVNFAQQSFPKEAEKKLKLDDRHLFTGVITKQNFHLNAEGCDGWAFIRPYAKASMQTANSSDEVTAYGDIVPL